VGWSFPKLLLQFASPYILLVGLTSQILWCVGCWLEQGRHRARSRPPPPSEIDPVHRRSSLPEYADPLHQLATGVLDPASKSASSSSG
jgi:hypothetical protein